MKKLLQRAGQGQGNKLCWGIQGWTMAGNHSHSKARIHGRGGRGCSAGQEREQGYLNPVRVGRAEEVTPSGAVEMVPKHREQGRITLTSLSSNPSVSCWRLPLAKTNQKRPRKPKRPSSSSTCWSTEPSRELQRMSGKIWRSTPLSLLLNH